MTFTPPLGVSYVALKVVKRENARAQGEILVDDLYFGEDFGFDQPPTPKTSFEGSHVRVDALGNIEVLKSGRWEAFFPLAMHVDNAREDFTLYSEQGWNCNIWAGSVDRIRKSKDAVSGLNPDGMMSGLPISWFTHPDGGGYNDTAALADFIGRIKDAGLMGHMLFYYWDNENHFDHWPVANAIIETIRKHDQDATGRPQHPIYALQGNFGVARTYAYAGLTDMVGTYVGGAEMTAGAAGGGDRGLTVLDRVEGQSNPVVLAQFNGVHGAGEMRRRLYTALMAGARAMGFWRDCYAPGCRQQWGRSVLPVEETEWWPDFPNLRREIDDLLLLIRQPHWTTWGLTATTSGAVAFGTREYKGEGYVLVANQKTTPASITFTIHDLSYTPESVQDHFSGREVVRVSNETFTVKLAGLGIGQGTAVYRLTKKAVPPQHMTY